MAASPMSAWNQEPDMDNRDPNNLNDHLKVSWEEIIGEPEHTRSIDTCWRCSFKCFNLWKSLCYCLMTVLCSSCIMMNWGCYFAGIAFSHIWILTPCIRAYEINLGICGRIYAIIIKSVLDPIVESFAKCLQPFVSSQVSSLVSSQGKKVSQQSVQDKPPFKN